MRLDIAPLNHGAPASAINGALAEQGTLAGRDIESGSGLIHHGSFEHWPLLVRLIWLFRNKD